MKTAKTPIKSADEETVQVIIQGVPKSVHGGFKACCAAKNRTMRDRIIELMKLDAADFFKTPNKI